MTLVVGAWFFPPPFLIVRFDWCDSASDAYFSKKLSLTLEGRCMHKVGVQACFMILVRFSAAFLCGAGDKGGCSVKGEA